LALSAPVQFEQPTAPIVYQTVHSSTQNRTTRLQRTKPQEEVSTRRRRARSFRVLPALLAIAVVSAGLLLWQFGRPRYRVYTSQAIGDRHTAFLISYPSDWYVDDSDTPVQGDGERTIALIKLRHSPAHGLQQWLDERLYRVGAQDWSDSLVMVGLQRAGSYRDIDTESRRMERSLQMLTRRGGTYSVRKSSCPAGPDLEIEVNLNQKTDPQIQQVLLVYPRVIRGDPQYEVVIQNIAMERLRGRLGQVAADVVSRLKLVKEQGRPSP
jgi:hypothetical protein